MRYFFIDLENVRNVGLEGVSSLDKDDTVFIFYSENANSLSIPTLESINNSKATAKYIKINYLGANAMDFQIVSLFSAMIEREKKGSFYIITHDKGFNSAISFCSSYFTDYKLRLGKFDTILLALADEVKQDDKTNDSSEAAGGEPKKKKRHKRSKKASEANVNANSNANLIDNQDSPSEGETAEASVKEQTGTAQSTEQNNTPKSAKKKKSGNGKGGDNGKLRTAGKSYGYVFDTLKGVLSDTTIGIYAEGIDKAIRTSGKSEQLEIEFKKLFDEDEAVALYRVIRADFDKMKKLSQNS